MTRKTINDKRLTNNVYVVILIGGKGKRLRPLSTDEKPKAFLSVTKDRKTMFRRTVLRAERLVPLSRIVVVANSANRANVKRDMPLLGKDNVFLEPVSRNTAPAIALAAYNLERRAGDCIMVVLPTDQYIIDEAGYIAALKKGVDFIRRHEDAIVIFGQKPTYAATGFGYIRVEAGRGRIAKVEQFTEKPDLKTAKKYLKSGRYLWNISTFIFKTNNILRAFKEFAPDILHGLKDEIDPAAYGKMPDISIDYAIMEKASGVYCVKSDCGWQDMGSFDALRKVLKREGRKFTETGGKITKII